MMHIKIAGLLIFFCCHGMFSPAQEFGQWIGTIDFSGTYNRGLGDFISTTPDEKSGYALPGGGMSATFSLRKYGSLMSLGLAYEFRASWHGIEERKLQTHLDDAFAVPEALGTYWAPGNRRWALITNMVGPLINFHGGPLQLEARFLVGAMSARNPEYMTIFGTYVPPGWGKFFLTEDNETQASQNRMNLVYSPKLQLLIPGRERTGWLIEGSFLFSQVEQELEVIYPIDNPGGSVVVRRQEASDQTIMMWSVGAGFYLRIY